jgi:hypothetical protein
LEKLALDIVGSTLTSSLAKKVFAEYNSVPEVHKVLRHFAKPGIESDSDLSYIVADDSDLEYAAAIIDVSASEAEATDPTSMPYYEFEMSDNKGDKKSFKFVVYRIKFDPLDVEEIGDSLVNVHGDIKNMKKQEIYMFLKRGQADKFVAGIEDVDSPTAMFDYNLLHLDQPDSKMAYVLEDDGEGHIKSQSQVDAVRNDYTNYLNTLKSKLNDYNQDIAYKIEEGLKGKIDKTPEAAAPAGGMPGMGMPPMPGGMPPMPI